MRALLATPLRLALAALLVAALAAPARAWYPAGHARVAQAAVRALPTSMPAFFRAGWWYVGQAAVDPDLMKDRTLVALTAAEWPEHFLDSELLQGPAAYDAPSTSSAIGALPPDRWSFIALLETKKLSPHDTGLLPYALIETEERLTEAFAEYRRWPDDPGIQQRALVYAGLLAHYAGDLDQPLHTTIHHDGRALPDGSSPRTGIHGMVDGLFDRAPIDVAALTRDLPIQAFVDPWASVQAELARSHTLVDEVYRLEPDLRAAYPPPPPAAPAATTAAPVAPSSAAAHVATTPVPATRVVAAPPSAAVMAFANDRFRTTASFIASLYLTAWERSALVQLPSWHHRGGPGHWDAGRAD